MSKIECQLPKFVLTSFPTQLLRGQNDLYTWRVLSVRNGVVEQANGSNNLASRLQLVTVLWQVAGIANHQGSCGGVVSAFDACNFALVIVGDFIYFGIEHIGAAMNGAEPGKRLREATKSVNGVQEWTITVSANGFHVELHLFD